MRKVKVVPVKSDIHIDTSQIPDSVAMNLAQVALHAIQEAYADPAVQEDYQRWKAAQESNQKKPEGENPRRIADVAAKHCRSQLYHDCPHGNHVWDGFIQFDYENQGLVQKITIKQKKAILNDTSIENGQAVP